MAVRNAFLLTHQQRQQSDGVELEYWLYSDSGPVRYRASAQKVVFFVQAVDGPRVAQLLADLRGWQQRELALKTLDQQPVIGLYFSRLDSCQTARQRLKEASIALFEDDLRAPERFLMERFLRGAVQLHGEPQQDALGPVYIDTPIRSGEQLPNLRLLSLDIETSLDASELYSVGLYGAGVQRVLMLEAAVKDRVVRERGGVEVRYLADERRLLEALLEEVQAEDPDILIGWHVIDFDFWVLERRFRQWGIPAALGRGGGELRLHRAANERWYASLPGRVILDGIECLKSAFIHFESYALQHVAEHLLGRGKLLEGTQRGEEIGRLFREDKPALAAYNLEDCRLVWEIFQRTDLIHHRVARTRLTGLALDKVGGSAAAFDNLYLPPLHRAGYVAPVYASGETGLSSPGGYVLDSLPGLYEQVLVLDFKSLYPSIIRTFKIDPMGLAEGLLAQSRGESVVPGFNRACFHRDHHILPGLLEALWQARDEAKREANQPLSQAIKIIMNAFYGVLGSDQCRFFDQRLSGSITLRGHEILTRSQAQIEQWGYRVIYGDTDSLFVWLKGVSSDQEADRLGQELARRLNAWWQADLQRRFELPCYLEIEYETHYSRFLMPTIRGSDKGSKKRYAGLVCKPGSPPVVVFKGLETVRSDWTPLARRFQQELYRRVFLDEPYADYIRTLVADLLAGKKDRELVYRKRLRRRLRDYQKSSPPHVQAARKAEAQRQQLGLPALFERGSSVSYLITTAGPEPTTHRQAPIDYEHYLQKQLAPVADGILPFVGTSFQKLLGRQQELF